MLTSDAFFKPESHQGLNRSYQVKVDGIDVNVIHAPYSNRSGFLFRVFAFIKFMFVCCLYAYRFRKYDVVYVTSTPLTVAVPALFLNKVFNMTMYFEVRDLWPDIPIELNIIKNRFIKFCLKKFELYVYRSAKKVVVLSEGMREEIVKKGISDEKLLLIPNASDVAFFDSCMKKKQPHKFELDAIRQQAIIGLYAGTFGYANDLSYVVELAKELKGRGANFSFFLIGDGAERDKLKKLVKSYNVNDVVKFLPAVSKEELVGYIQAADFCISTVRNSPALYNNSANKFFDALAAGRPIVINHEGWMKKSIDNNGLGLVLNYDIGGSAVKLEAFFSSYDIVTGEKRIKAYAKSHFDRELLFNRLYQSVFSNHNIN
jgi:glycosyltransferase involved in cell wall biosynthesis